MAEVVQSVVEPYMTGQNWDDILALITANNTNEEAIVILAWVGYFLKFVPFFPISVTGWCLDFALDVLQFQKNSDRATIF